jgi:hypothetical protein
VTLTITHFDRKNLKQLAAVDKLASPDTAWSTERFFTELGEPNATGNILLKDDTVIAGMVYHCGVKSLHVIHLVLHPNLNKESYQAVVKHLMDYLKNKLKRERTVITISVRETNLQLQLALAAAEVGFKAFKVKRTGFIDTLEDAFLFRFTKSELNENMNVLTAESSDFIESD